MLTENKCWELVKYPDEKKIYARCKCGYEYDCMLDSEYATRSEEKSNKIVPDLLFNYCPSCGKRKKYYYEDIRIINIISYKY